MKELSFEQPPARERTPGRRDRVQADEPPAFRRTPSSPDQQRRAGRLPSRPAGPLIWRPGRESF